MNELLLVSPSTVVIHGYMVTNATIPVYVDLWALRLETARAVGGICEQLFLGACMLAAAASVLVVAWKLGEVVLNMPNDPDYYDKRNQK